MMPVGSWRTIRCSHHKLVASKLKIQGLSDKLTANTVVSSCRVMITHPTVVFTMISGNSVSGKIWTYCECCVPGTRWRVLLFHPLGMIFVQILKLPGVVVNTNLMWRTVLTETFFDQRFHYFQARYVKISLFFGNLVFDSYWSCRCYKWHPLASPDVT